MEILNTILNSKAVLIILEAVLTFLAGYIAKKVNGFLNTKTKKEVAKSIVMAVEQMYKNLHGEEKLNKALSMFSDTLAEKGITATNAELLYLLESAVGEFNNVFDVSQEAENITEEAEIGE